VSDVDFPFAIDDRRRTAVAGYADHVRDMIEQLVLTSPGERVNRPDFGSGLMQMVFEPSSPEIAATLQLTIHAALQRWLGDVIEPAEVMVDSTEGTLRVTVAYTLLGTGEQRTDTFTEAVA
jgi:uncharacterized protein